MNPDAFHVCADCRVSSPLIKSITKQTNAIMFKTWQGEGDQNRCERAAPRHRPAPADPPTDSDPCLFAMNLGGFHVCADCRVSLQAVKQIR